MKVGSWKYASEKKSHNYIMVKKLPQGGVSAEVLFFEWKA